MLPIFSPTIAPYVTTTQSPDVKTSPSVTPKTMHTVKKTTSTREPRPTKESGKKHQSGQPGEKGYAPKEFFYSLMNHAITEDKTRGLVGQI